MNNFIVSEHDIIKDVISMDRVRTVVTECIDVEMARIMDDRGIIISRRLLEWYLDNNVYMSNSHSYIKNTTEFLFSNREFRDYILNLTVRIHINLSLSTSDWDSLTDIMKAALFNTGSITPKPITDGFIEDEAVMNDILKNDKWFSTLLFITMWFNDTITYKNLIIPESK